MQHHGMPDFTIFLQHNAHRKVSLSGAWVSCDTTPTFLSLGSITHRDISVITAITPTSSLRLPWQAFATKTHKSHLSALEDLKSADSNSSHKSTKRIYTQILRGFFWSKQHTSQAASKNSQIIAPTDIPSTNVCVSPSIFRKRRRLYSVKGR